MEWTRSGLKENLNERSGSASNIEKASQGHTIIMEK
jgi:hypothetical protein